MKKYVFGLPRSHFAKAAMLVVSVCLLFLFPCFLKNDGGRVALNASAASYGDVMEIESYQVNVLIREDRQIEFKETIQMKALKSGSVFTRYLPLANDRYYDIVATTQDVSNGDYSANPQGVGDDFSYNVFLGEEDDYLHIDCVVPVQKNQTRIYEISYIMEIGEQEESDAMTLDVIGYGWGVPLNNVEVIVQLPAPISSQDFKLYSGAYGASGNDANVESQLSNDGKTIALRAKELKLAYNDYYYETMAQGITLQLDFENDVFQSYAQTRVFTKQMLWIVIAGVVLLILACVVRLSFRKKPDLIPVVNIKAPDELDPLQMGKILDGVVDQEDITSMLYYFAEQGYLSIDLEDQDNPVLVKKVESLPANAAHHQKTLFNGLFLKGDRVAVSDLKGNFYSTVDIAKRQVLGIPMYEKKSIFGFLAGGIFGALLGFFVPFLSGAFRVGGGFAYPLGLTLAFPIAMILFLAYMGQCYRFKWKAKILFAIKVANFAIFILASLIFTFGIANLLMTEAEKAVLCAFVFLSTFLTQGALTRTETYTKKLGDILGFKDFIVVTEEDKIKFMLEENPHLYYKILPYAQVLGVTNEWEEKFASLTIAPPTWYENSDFTLFDYMIFNHALNRSMRMAIMPPKSQGNGSFAGRSGGGGFGGFGGGGHGGGGGGFR